MEKIIDVQIGQVRVAQGKVILNSTAIGSCIAIVVYDATKKIGALAHVMLPGRAPKSKPLREKTRYTADAVDVIATRMEQLGSKSKDIEVVLIGGANVLGKEDDTICEQNIRSVMSVLQQKSLRIRAQYLGGNKRRSVWLDVGAGVVSYTQGNSVKKRFLKFSVA